jgi:hypothetical protein
MSAILVTKQELEEGILLSKVSPRPKKKKNRPYLKNKLSQKDLESRSPVVECLSSKQKALNSNLNTTKNKD